MAKDLTVSEARVSLRPAAFRAEYGGETTYLITHDRRTVVVVSAAEELLAQIEDLIDTKVVRSALAAI